MSQRSYHLTPNSRLQFGCYNKTQTSDNILPFRPEITWVMATFCIAADRSKFHSIPVSLWGLKCGPRDSIGPRKIWKVSKIVYTILLIPWEKSGARLYLPGTPVYWTPVHFKQKEICFYSETFLWLLCMVPLKPSQLTDCTVKILNCCLVSLFPQR